MAVKQKRRSQRRPTSGVRHLPRLEIVADEETLTPFGGSAVVGELVRRLGLIPALDRAIAEAPRIGGLKPIKERQRGASPGALLVALADSLLLGGDAMQDLELLRADAAGAEVRAVEEIPAASTAAQLARRFRRTHLRAAEEAFARVANFDRQLERDPARPVTLDSTPPRWRCTGAASRARVSTTRASSPTSRSSAPGRSGAGRSVASSCRAAPRRLEAAS
ncbi:MAG: hypothetical protein KatS3mg012_1823 [Gaiellaceae bacterium]|nr:MAG: hypothetical protein KatS3mg012_1823 [Gaiellaceae bacterium]